VREKQHAESPERVTEQAPEPLHGEVLEAPREGTLAWLVLQPTVDVHGLELPARHRIPASATLAPADGGSCRVVHPERGRCRAPATKRYGICLVHAGGGGMLDPRDLAAKASAARTRLKQTRKLLGVGPVRGANPRQTARLLATARAQDVAEALLAPLDDGKLGSLERQGAMLRMLDATWPLQQTTVEVELPADEAGVEALSWAQMQALAAELLA